jgi:hypothetical protein
MAVLDPREVVGLVDEEVLIIQRGHLAVVVDERIGVAVVRPEPPAVDDVRERVPVVVDVDVVVRAFGPEVEVRTARGFLEGDPRADERYLGWSVFGDERVQVGRVDRGIAGDQRCFAVAGCGRGDRAEPGERRNRERTGDGERGGSSET